MIESLLYDYAPDAFYTCLLCQFAHVKSVVLTKNYTCVCVTCVSEQLAAIIRSTTGRAAAARRSR